MALFSGLTDIDALTLSTFRLLEHEGIEASAAATAVCPAIAANFDMNALIVARRPQAEIDAIVSHGIH